MNSSTSVELTGQPASSMAWLGAMADHLPVAATLAKAEFQARYKRAHLGLTWAVAVPLIQAAILGVVFAAVVKAPPNAGDSPYGLYVLSGVLVWSYFASVIGAGATAIVDGSGLTDKVWFPRGILALVPAMSNLVALAVSLGVLLIAAVVLGSGLGWHTLWLIPAAAGLVAFAATLSLALSALHVYFRDVRYLVQAGLMMWFYVTPIVYPLSILPHWLAAIVEINPVTGIVGLFRLALLGRAGPLALPLAVSMGALIVVLGLAISAHRRYDRLFADLL